MNFNQITKKLYKFSAAFLAITLMLPAPSYGARQAATGVSGPILSRLKAELRDKLGLNEAPLDHMGVPLVDLSRDSVSQLRSELREAPLPNLIASQTFFETRKVYLEGLLKNQQAILKGFQKQKEQAEAAQLKDAKVTPNPKSFDVRIEVAEERFAKLKADINALIDFWEKSDEKQKQELGGLLQSLNRLVVNRDKLDTQIDAAMDGPEKENSTQRKKRIADLDKLRGERLTTQNKIDSLETSVAKLFSTVRSEVRLSAGATIGFLRKKFKKADEQKLSDDFVARNDAALAEVNMILANGVQSILNRRKANDENAAIAGYKHQPVYDEFNKAFARVLRLSQGNMKLFYEAFRNLHTSYDLTLAVEQAGALGLAIANLAQDKGTPEKGSSLSYYNPARYVYARFAEEKLNRFSSAIVSPLVNEIRTQANAENLSDVFKKKELIDALIRKFGDGFGLGRQTRDGFQYVIEYDSLTQKDGEIYFIVRVLVDGDKDVSRGVPIDLRVVIPANGHAVQYQSPYPIPTQEATTNNYAVGLRDSIHFAKTIFPERNFQSYRDILESVMQTQKEGVLKSFIRVAHRSNMTTQGVLQASLKLDSIAPHHLAGIESEKVYGLQGGPWGIQNLEDAVDNQGGIGWSPAMIRDPEMAALAEKNPNRRLVLAWEADHMRVTAVPKEDGSVTGEKISSAVKAFAGNLENVFLSYLAYLSTGQLSSDLQDEGTKMSQKRRHGAKQADGSTAGGETLAAIKKAAADNKISPELFAEFHTLYNKLGLAENALPSPMEFHFLRNTWLRHQFATVGAENGNVPYNRLYTEVDFAIDGKPHTVDEMMYLTMQYWTASQAFGYPLSAIVPSYGNEHGAKAGSPNFQLANILQYAAQVVSMYGEAMPAAILAISQKAPAGSKAKFESLIRNFKDEELRDEALEILNAVQERTPGEEEELKAFQLAQLQKVPENVMHALKNAQDLAMQVKELEKAAAKTLDYDDSTSQMALRQALIQRDQAIQTMKDLLDAPIQELPVERLVKISSHAGSGTSKEQLQQVSQSGIWILNKSTEWRLMMLKMRHILYLWHTNREVAQKELKKLPEIGQLLWNERIGQISESELQAHAELYAKQYDGIWAMTQKKDPADKVAKYKYDAALRSVDWQFIDGKGWTTLGNENNWFTNSYGRYMDAQRDKDGVLVYPNVEEWGTPAVLLEILQPIVAFSLEFYHGREALNAEGTAAAFWAHQADRASAATAAAHDEATDASRGDAATRSELRATKGILVEQLTESYPWEVAPGVKLIVQSHNAAQGEATFKLRLLPGASGMIIKDGRTIHYNYDSKNPEIPIVLLNPLKMNEIVTIGGNNYRLFKSSGALKLVTAGSARSEVRFVEGTKFTPLSPEEAAKTADKRKFGTNGVRGDDITSETLQRISAGSVEVLKTKWEAEHSGEPLPWIIVGFDPRPQGPNGFEAGEMSEAKAMAETAAAYGFSVLFVPKAVPAPFLIANTGKNKHPKNVYAALMRTASHNEVLDPSSGQLVSGIKLFTGNAPASDALTGQVSKLILNETWMNRGIPSLSFDEAVKQGRIVVVKDGDENDPETVEWNRINKVFDLKKIGQLLKQKFPEMEIALNTMHGGMSNFAVRVLDEMGVKYKAFNTTLMNDEVNREKMTGFIHYKDPATGEDKQARFAPDPTRPWMRGAKYQAFVDSMLKKIVALLIDGDADRLVAEQQGKEMIPNNIALTAIKYLWDQGERGRIVRTVPTAGALDDLARALGADKPVAITDVGSKWFDGPNKYYDGTLEDVVVAAEESGHIVFKYKGELFFDHSIALALLMLEMMAETGKTWNEQLDDTWKFITEKTGAQRKEAVRTGINKNEGAPKYYDLVAKLSTPDQKESRDAFTANLVAALKQEGIDWEVEGFDLTAPGGIQIQFKGGRRLMPRKSGTDGSLRLYIEVLTSEIDKVPTLVKVLKSVLEQEVQPKVNREEVEEGVLEVLGTYAGEKAAQKLTLSDALSVWNVDDANMANFRLEIGQRFGISFGETIDWNTPQDVIESVSGALSSRSELRLQEAGLSMPSTLDVINAHLSRARTSLPLAQDSWTSKIQADLRPVEKLSDLSSTLQEVQFVLGKVRAAHNTVQGKIDIKRNGRSDAVALALISQLEMAEKSIQLAIQKVEQAKEVIAEILQIKKEQVLEASSLQDLSAKVDSNKKAELAHALEGRLRILIPKGSEEKWETVSDALNAVLRSELRLDITADRTQPVKLDDNVWIFVRATSRDKDHFEATITVASSREEASRLPANKTVRAGSFIDETGISVSSVNPDNGMVTFSVPRLELSDSTSSPVSTVLTRDQYLGVLQEAINIAGQVDDEASALGLAVALLTAQQKSLAAEVPADADLTWARPVSDDTDANEQVQILYSLALLHKGFVKAQELKGTSVATDVTAIDIDHGVYKDSVATVIRFLPSGKQSSAELLVFLSGNTLDTTMLAGKPYQKSLIRLLEVVINSQTQEKTLPIKINAVLVDFANRLGSQVGDVSSYREIAATERTVKIILPTRSEVRRAEVSQGLFDGLKLPEVKNRAGVQRSVIAPVASETGNGSIFSADFAFGPQGGLELIPFMTAGGPAVVVLDQNNLKATAQKRVVEALNLKLKASGLREIAIARNGFEAVEALNLQLADLELRTGQQLGKVAYVVDRTQGLVRELKAAKLSEKDLISVTGVQFQSMMRRANIQPSQTQLFVQRLEAMGAVSSAA